MRLKLVLLMGLMSPALQASELNPISDSENFFNSSDSESVEDFFLPPESPRDAEKTGEDESLDDKEDSDSKLSLGQLKSHNVVGSVTTDMTDDERLAAAIKASLELDQKRRVFQSAQAAAAQSPKSPLGIVAFAVAVVMRNAQNTFESKDSANLQGAINNVRTIQLNNILTDDQSNQVDQMLVKLACAFSVVTNHENLGAR